MIFSAQGWLRFLGSESSAYGIPLILGGLALMIFGWRLWKLCVVVSFGLIGAIAGSYLGDPNSTASWYAGIGAILLAALSYRPARHAITLLGGLVGAGVVANVLSSAGLSGTLLWLGTTLGFMGCFGLSFLNRAYVVILVTSFLGAALLISGLTAAAMTSSGLYSSLRNVASSSAFIVPFLVVVPTVMSCFLQASEVRRIQIEL